MSGKLYNRSTHSRTLEAADPWRDRGSHLPNVATRHKPTNFPLLFNLQFWTWRLTHTACAFTRKHLLIKWIFYHLCIRNVNHADTAEFHRAVPSLA